MNDPIDQRQRKSGSISNLLDGYMQRFTVRESPLLFDFEDDWQLIKSGTCPVCLCQLKVSQKGDVYCSSKRHLGITKKRLFIRAEKFK